jgi:hypothetical protein
LRPQALTNDAAAAVPAAVSATAIVTEITARSTNPIALGRR